MEMIGATDARANFAELLRRVSDGGAHFAIERRGQPRAALVPIEDLELIERAKSGAPSERPAESAKAYDLFEETERLARLGHWEWDEIEDKAIYCSLELARLHGVTVEEYLSRASSTEADCLWVHPEDRDRYAQATLGLKNQGIGFEIDYRMARPDSLDLHVREVANPVFADDGSLVRSIGFVQDLTEVYQKQQELEGNASLLRQAAGLANLGYWIWDEILDRCIFCSETLAKMNGVTVEEYLRKSATMSDLLPAIHPEDRQRYAQVMRTAQENQSAYEVEFRDLGVDGIYRHFYESAEPVFDVNGTMIQTIGTLQDISVQRAIEQALRVATEDLEEKVEERTAEFRKINRTLESESAERQKAQADLRSSEAMLQAFTKYSPAEIGIKDREGRYVLVNPVSERLYGLSSDEIVGRLPHDIFPKDVADQLVAHDQEVLTQGKTDTREITGVIDGEERNYLATKFTISNASDELVGLGAIATDITDQKRAEIALRASEERYRELFDDSPVAIWEEDWSPIKQMLDELSKSGVKHWRSYFEGRRDQLKRAYDLAIIIDISKATLDLYHEENKEELLQGTTSDSVVTEELDAFLETICSFLDGQVTVDIESRDVAGDGVEIMVRRRVAILPKHRDDWSRVIYAVEDITDRARAEEQLRLAQKMDAVGQLTSGIAHDFNNLLAVITGNAEMLKTRFEPNEDFAVAAIIRSVRRGAELTQRLLAFSRQQPLSPQVVELTDLASGMIQLLTRTLGENFEIESKAEWDLWNAFADRGQVENALLNLALNARDAMPNGGKLTIECRNVRLEESFVTENPGASVGDFVVLAVSDEGIGMTAEVRAQAFEPFFTTKKVGQGSGLGLSMIYGFAKQSGGHVVIDSELGRGATVSLYLPRAEAPVHLEAAPEEPAIPMGEGEAILVVEDDPDLRSLAVQVLEGLNYSVIGVGDAAMARRVLTAGEKVDLMLSDVVMPGGTSGPELAIEVRATYPDIKIIFMSGYPAEAIKDNGLIGSDYVLLNKPFEMHLLAKTIREALE